MTNTNFSGDVSPDLTAQVPYGTGNKNPPQDGICWDCQDDCNKFWWLKTAGVIALFVMLLPVVTGNTK